MYNPRENKKYVGIIVDRNGPDNSCKVFLPEIHGVNVSIDDLGWSRFTVPPGGSEASTSYGTPDTGQLVTCTVNTTGGSTVVEINGLYQTKQSTDPANPNNTSLNLAFPQWALALQTQSPIRVPPQSIQEQTVDGAVIRQPQERDTLHSHSLLTGINSTAAYPPLNGSILPPVTVGTAVQATSMALSSSILAGLNPSASSTIGSLFSGAILSALQAVMPPTLYAALASTTALMTTVEAPSSSYKIKPNTEIVLKNARSRFRNCNTTAEVHATMRELMSNTQLQNEGSRKANVAITTSYGDATVSVDMANGTISMSLSDAASAAMSAFASMLSSIQGANGTQMFGNSSSTIQQMGERLADETKKAEFKVRTSDNASDTEGTEMRVKADEKAIAFVGSI